jgi:tRNA pseudouridine38-40 synthase
MRRAAEALVGLHDFAAYCRPREGATTIRDLQRLAIAEDVDQVLVEVTADAFCHSMVRSLVGTLVAVGENRAGIDVPAALLAGRARTAALSVAPACGLTLVRVDYPPDELLAQRALTTRAVRSAPNLPHRAARGDGADGPTT